MIKLRDLNLYEIKTLVRSMDEPDYRAGQIFKWTQSGAAVFDEMTDLPKTFREKLALQADIRPPEMVTRLIARDGTRKYLWRYGDGNCVETVLMTYEHGVTVCVSTQAGCRMGCAFCASTKDGLARDLTPGEMIEQVLFAGKDAGVRVGGIVLMGSGEPLDNYDNVLKFLELVQYEHGLGIGARHISLSTCGLVDKIKELQKLCLQITLSVSLHGPNNKIRSALMPINKKYPIEALIPACREYALKTGRRVSYEYALVRGLNDTPECARELANLLRGSLAHVNLIRLNKIAESRLEPTSDADARRFCKMLENYGLTATIRRRLGFDIDASCGQLRRRYRGNEVN